MDNGGYGRDFHGDLRRSIQAYSNSDDAIDGAYLSGYMVTCEWLTPDGEKYISTIRSENSTSWQCMGYAMETISQSIANDVAMRLFDSVDSEDED